MSRLPFRLAALILLFSWFQPPGSAGASTQRGSTALGPPEVVYRLSQFVQWPNPSSQRPEFHICLIGDDPDYIHWTALMARRELAGRNIVVRHVNDRAQIRGCEVAVVGRSLQSRARSILTAISNQPVLTVGAFPGFASLGGIVELTQSEPRRIMTLNPVSARRAGLVLCDGILSVASISRFERMD
ncbi:MAG: YfiR family protein [Acidobacteria bacterium]|nr:YfiR family protein [Acidobacteriota bacterium]